MLFPRMLWCSVQSTPIKRLTIKFLFTNRCSSLPQCSLWCGYWSNPPGRCWLPWQRKSSHLLPTCLWSIHPVSLWPLGGCWSEMSRYSYVQLNACWLQYQSLWSNLLQSMPVATVPMVIFVWWEASISMKVEWRCASMTSGGQCVMTLGTVLMLLWSASNWDTHTLEVSWVWLSSTCLKLAKSINKCQQMWSMWIEWRKTFCWMLSIIYLLPNSHLVPK